MNKKRLKVLFVIHTLGGGGAENVLVNTVNQLSKDNDVTLMTLIDVGINKERLNDNVKYKTIFKPPFKSKKSTSLSSNKTSNIKKGLIKVYTIIWKNMPIKFLRKLFIKSNYDVEIAFLEGITAKFVSESKTKKICWIHVDMNKENKSDAFFKNIKEQEIMYNKFDKIVSVSKNVQNEFLTKFPNISIDKCEVLYNPIDRVEILNKSMLNSDIDYFKADYPKVITIGRLAKQKGYDRLLRVCKRLKDENYKFKLIILGIGELHDEYNEYIISNELDEYVVLAGYIDNPYKYLVQSDFFVCSSITEGFSTVVSEASILEIPTVTTDCPGMYELFGDNEYGYIVQNDENGIYNGMKYYFDNPSKVAEYKNKLKKMNQRFDLKKSVIEVEKLLNEVKSS